MDCGARLKKLHGKMDESGLDAVLITSPENRFYLSGFTGTAGVLFISKTHAYLVTDARYLEQAQHQAPAFSVQRHHGEKDFMPLFQHMAEESSVSAIGFENVTMPVEQWKKWREGLAKYELVELDDRLNQLRRIKDPEELDRIRKATRLAEDALIGMLGDIRPGTAERELALELEYRMRKAGADKPSFDFIVASGPRSALPHGVASERLLQPGDLVTFDFGCYYKGYASDETRTFILGKATERQKEVYRIVLEAQLAALSIIKPGVSTREVDRAARELIEKHGYGDYFGHGLGHGVGINIHETPVIGPTAPDMKLEAGMVVTVEPGIYLPEWGGVRIEDTVILTPEGHENLARQTKELLELPV